MLIRKSKRIYFFTKFEKKKKQQQQQTNKQTNESNMKQTWQAINDIIGKGRR